MAEKKASRTRNYATVVYPESAPENWKEILSNEHIPCFISPLHDKDVNPDGEIKKPHYHVLLMFESVKTVEQAMEVFAKIGGVGREIVNSVRGYSRYLIHQDNPEKAQYNASDVVSYAGADYDAVTHLPTDDVVMIREMMLFIRTNQIYSFARFADYCATENYDWFVALTRSCTYFIKEYIKTLAWEQKEKYEPSDER